MRIILILFMLPLCAAGQRLLTESTPYTAGTYNYYHFRIPALIAAPDGTILAFAEARMQPNDTGDINLVLRRSFDGGAGWTEPAVIWDDGANTCGNPVPVVDESSGRIWLFMTHNLGQDTYSEIVNGTSDGVRTIWSCYSDDNGASWSAPACRFNEVQNPDVRWDATGPGNGIQMRGGSKAGRLLIPATGRNIYSDDHGQSWKQSAYLPSGGDEAVVVELSGGTIIHNDRAASASLRAYNRRIISYSYNNGASWSAWQISQQLVCPICQASSISAPTPDGGRVLLFSNPASTLRERMTVRLSQDDGRNWAYSKLIYGKKAAYSSLAALKDGSIGLLYEGGSDWTYRSIYFVRFEPEWLKEKSVFRWDFEQCAGGVVAMGADKAYDTRGYGLDGYAESSFDIVAGAKGAKAVRFKGAGKGIRITDLQSRDALDFGQSESFLIRAVFRTTAHAGVSPAESGAIIAKDTASASPSWWLRVQGGKLRFFVDDGSNASWVDSSMAVNDGLWHEAIVCRDALADKLIIYIDDMPAGSVTDATAGSFANDNDIVAGCFNTAAASFIGDLDLLQVLRGTRIDVLTEKDGDINGDGAVDNADLFVIMNNWLDGFN